MTEMRVDLRKVEAGDPVEMRIYAAIQVEVKAGNLQLRGYDNGVQVYGKLPMKVGDEHN